MKRRNPAKHKPRIVYTKHSRKPVKQSGSLLPHAVVLLGLLGAYAMGNDTFEETHQARLDAGYFEGQRIVRVPASSLPADDGMTGLVAKSLAEADAHHAAHKPVARLTPRQIVRKAAKAEGVDPHLMLGLAATESGFNPRAVSRAGACGLTQLMPATAQEVGVDDCRNPKKNARGGARYLKRMLARYRGNVKLALIAYNWGYGNVDRWLERGANPDELPEETRSYPRKVLHRAAIARSKDAGVELASR